MRKTLYIHIGTGKTGSTAIQSFMAKNRNVLSDKYGLLYPETALYLNKHRAIDLNARRNDLDARDKIKLLIDSLNNEIMETPCPIIVISDEDFPGLSKDEVTFYRDNIHKDIDVKFIVYLRRQDEFLESWFNQIVKTGSYNSDIKNLKETLVEKGVFDYMSLIEMWESVLGKDSAVVRVYEKDSFFGGNIFSDFMNVFDIDYDGLEVPEKDPNPSLTRDKILLLRKFSNNGLRDLIDNNFIEHLIKLNPELGDEKLVLSPSERKKFLSSYSGVNSRVALKYLKRDTLFLNVEVNDEWKPRISIPDKLMIEMFKYCLKDG